jgi:poly-gamma-glutamate synthesis protein (capsule biosynthesis protein)
MRQVAGVWAVSVVVCACDPYSHWPDPEQVFPHVYTPQTGLEDYEEVRWETETWSTADYEMVGLYLKKLFNPRKGAPREVLEHFRHMRQAVPPLTTPAARLSFVGDLMWVGGNWEEFAKPAGKLLDGDLRLGNLETPTSPDHPPEDNSMAFTFNSPIEMLEALPLDLLQLNNNHSLDMDDLGLEKTVEQVEAHGYQHVGVDAQRSVDVKGLKVALLAYTWGINDGRRSKKGHELHIVPFGHLDHPIDLTLIEEQTRQARDEGAQLVVVLVHWGFEHEWYPDPHFLVLGRRIVKAGADLVVGHGPHVVQPVEICHVNRPEQVPGVGACSVRTPDERPRTAAIIYSLGNFGTTMPMLSQRVGLVATVSIDGGGVTGLGWSAAVSLAIKDSSGTTTGQSVIPLADLLSDPLYAEEHERLESHLGRGWGR